jgi:hypothetical protein
MRKLRSVLVGTAIGMLILSSSVSASSTVVSDPAGDAVAGAPAYVDIVQSKVTAQTGRDTLYFSMELAQAIPANPPDDFLGYNWFVDTTAPAGFDYVVVVRFCTERTGAACEPGPLPRWEGLVNDFVNPPKYFTSFKVDGATVKAFLDPALIGGSTSFEWQGLSRTRPAGSGVAPRDFAPEVCCASFGR